MKHHLHLWTLLLALVVSPIVLVSHVSTAQTAPRCGPKYIEAVQNLRKALSTEMDWDKDQIALWASGNPYCPPVPIGYGPNDCNHQDQPPSFVPVKGGIDDNQLFKVRFATFTAKHRPKGGPRTKADLMVNALKSYLSSLEALQYEADKLLAACPRPKS